MFKIRARRLWREFQANLIVQLLAWIGGSSMLSAIGRAIWQSWHRHPSDWASFGVLLAVGIVLLLVAAWLQSGREPQISARELEEKLREQRAAIEEKIPRIMINGELPDADVVTRVNPKNDEQIYAQNINFLKEQLADCQHEKKLSENQSSADLSRSREAYRQCEEERRAALENLAESANQNLEYRAQLAMFSPLQLDALQIAKDLLDFAAEMGEEPVINSADYPCTSDGQVAFMLANSKLRSERELKFRSKFRLCFGDRLKNLVDRLGAQKIECGGFLEAMAHADIDNTPDAVRAAESLVSVAYKLVGLRVYPPRPYSPGELATMNGNEINRRNHEEPGFADTWAQYRESKKEENL